MRTTIERCDYETPIGRWRATARDGAIVRMEPVDPRGPVLPPRTPLFVALGRELERYFEGALEDFTVPIAPEGTPFQREVWSALREIHRGTTLSYAELARRVGRPRAQRAVGAANGKNPIAILIPCHRVVGARGALTGFAWGVERKAWLLEHEARAHALRA